MVLPDKVANCDAAELAALNINKLLSDKDLAKQFSPTKDISDVEADLREVLYLAKRRQLACPNVYPFEVTDRSIRYMRGRAFNPYTFLLLGRSLDMGGPVNAPALLERFRDLFEDVVCWSMRKSGFKAEVLSIPRAGRGLDTQLVPALRQIAQRFQEPAALREDRLMPHDNDLDVDVIAMPIGGNGAHGGWPVFGIQCATGAIKHLQSKIEEGAKTFGTVWEDGFYPGAHLRAAATPDDLISLERNYWTRLGQAGWVLDRTTIAYLASGNNRIALPGLVSNFWSELWAARSDISWQTGWRQP